jgi:hypothetical protein
MFQRNLLPQYTESPSTLKMETTDFYETLVYIYELYFFTVYLLTFSVIQTV